MHPPYHPIQRQQVPSQGLDPTRQAYIPPPPPPATSSSALHGHGIPYPPPPPRLAPNQPQGPIMPPPPVGPHGSSHGWQSWVRQNNNFPLPPPNNGQHATYNPNAYYGYQVGALAFPPQLSADNQPLTSATYIPLGESFGPGVGIPPLNPLNAHSYPPLRSHPDPQSHYYGGESLTFTPVSNGSGSNTGTTYNSGVIYPAINDTTYYVGGYSGQTTMPSIPTNADSNTASGSLYHHSSTTKTATNNHNVTALPPDPASQWPLERVVAWLNICTVLSF